MHAHFERRDAVMRLKVVVLGLEGAEKALDHRIVKEVPFATHDLFDSVMLKHRSVRLHLVMGGFNRSSQHRVGDIPMNRQYREYSPKVGAPTANSHHGQQYRLQKQPECKAANLSDDHDGGKLVLLRQTM